MPFLPVRKLRQTSDDRVGSKLNFPVFILCPNTSCFPHCAAKVRNILKRDQPHLEEEEGTEQVLKSARNRFWGQCHALFPMSIFL